MLLIDCASKGEQQSSLKKENKREIRMFVAVQSKSVIDSCHIMKDNFRKGTAYS